MKDFEASNVTVKVIQLLAHKFGVMPHEINVNQPIEQLDIDSLDIVETFFDLEQQFNIEIPYNLNEKNVGELTINDIVDMVKEAVDARTNKV
jgi:acyl carrier protein